MFCFDADWVGALASVMTGIGAIWAVRIAQEGLDTWRQQLHGTSRFQVARALARAALDFREALRSVRNPFLSAAEKDAATTEFGLTRKEGTTEEEWSRTQTQAAYNKRWKLVLQARGAMEHAKLDAEVHLGAEVRSRVVPLAKMGRRLYAAMVMQLQFQDQATLRRSVPTSDATRELEDRTWADLYDMGEDDKPDDFTQALESAVTDLMVYLQRPLKGH